MIVGKQVNLDAGRAHINRRKNGTPSTHPLGGTAIRALRKLKRDYPATQYVFVTERNSPLTDSAVRKLSLSCLISESERSNYASTNVRFLNL